MNGLAKLTLSKPFPDKCGWFEAVEREQEWHINQASHYITKMEENRSLSFYALGHALIAFPYHVPLLNCLIYSITYIFYAAIDPHCMEKALNRARAEGNRGGIELLTKRLPEVPQPPPEPEAHIYADYHQRMKHVLENQSFCNCVLLTGPAGVGKTTIATSYPENILVIDHLDEWEKSRVEAFLRRMENQPVIGCCRRKGNLEPLLDRHFTEIKVTEPDRESMLNIMKKAFPEATEGHLAIAISKARGTLPGSAIHLYDEAPDKEQIVDFAHQKYEIPSFSEEKIEGLETYLKDRIKGQDQAIQEILPSLRNFARGRGTHTGLHFAGLTGTGKTEMAHVIAEWIYGSRDKVLQIDMGRHQHTHAEWTLLGSPSGLVGHEKGGIILERAKEGPFLLLLDDIHQSSPECISALIQRLCDKGKLLDPLTGKDIDMSHIFVILTSNFGAAEIREGMREGTEYLLFRKPTINPTNYSVLLEITKKVERAFFMGRHETLNRFRTVPFSPVVDEEVIDQVVEKFLDEEKTMHEIEIEWSQEFIYWVTNTYGRNTEEGMRGIRYYIQNQLRDAITQTKAAKIQLEDGGEITVLED